MRATQYLLATLKEIPKNCEIISHQLMLRSGMIRQVSSGLYIWLPTGVRVLKKIEKIIHEEMNKINFIEIFMPITQPARLWEQSGRWLEYGPELLRFKNRSNQKFVLGPTHEEIISNFICKETISFKQFPVQVYQINTKYRDEARSRFGTIRSKEFIMKDGYSFHINQQSLQNTYNDVYQQYHAIFNRIGLNFCVVQADPGNIGGILSHEFQAYSTYGEDKIAIPKKIFKNHNYQTHNYTNNIKNNIILIPTKIQAPSPQEIMRLIELPNNTSILELFNQLNLPLHKTIKFIIVRTNNQHNNNLYNFLGLVIRADHQLNHEKLLAIPNIEFPLSILSDKDIKEIIRIKPTLLNFIKLSIPVIIDYHVAIMNDFVTESDIHNKYFFGVNWNRDLPMPKIADLYTATYINNYTKKNKIENNIICKYNSIEIGHIFQLGEKYTSKIYNDVYKNNNNNNTTITMGCYGIGITRIIPVLIEQHYDKHGIVWPEEIAPFKLAIIPVNMYHSVQVKNITEQLYSKLSSIIGSDIFIDDRKINPGTMFTDIDLIGIPHIIIISERTLNNQEVEYKYRKTGILKKFKLDSVIQFLIKKLIHP